MYSLKPLKRINTNARLSIKIEVKKVGFEMTLEFRYEFTEWISVKELQTLCGRLDCMHIYDERN